MRLNSGIRIAAVTPTTTARTSTAVTTSHDIPASWRSAMMMPPMAMMGAATMKFMNNRNVICTCWTSFVPRVTSVAAPKCAISSLSKSDTRLYTAALMSRPVSMATWEANHTAAIAAAICTSATASIVRPVRQIYGTSAWATPLLMMSAFKSGKYSVARVVTSCSTITSAILPLYRLPKRAVRWMRSMSAPLFSPGQS